MIHTRVLCFLRAKVDHDYTLQQYITPVRGLNPEILMLMNLMKRLHQRDVEETDGAQERCFSSSQCVCVLERERDGEQHEL